MKLEKSRTGVLVVDVQGDFTEDKNGSLAVPGTDKRYLDKVTEITRVLKDKGLLLFATRDCHPNNHVSFVTSHAGRQVMDNIEINGRSQILWPPHCIEGNVNSEVLIDNTLFEAVVKKGCDPQFDSYSGFFDDGGAATGLEQILRNFYLETLLVYGLATDYCVKFTVLDALKTGFDVILVEDLCQGVAKETTRLAIEEIAQAGGRLSTSGQILKSL